MAHSSCYAGPGCLGCSMCESDEPENDLQAAQRRKREEDALRAEGKPTLRVKLGDLLQRALKP